MDILLEERRAFRAGPPAVTGIPCSECGEYLMKVEFAKGFEYVCDNCKDKYKCPLFRVPQRTELKELHKSRTMAHFNNLEGYLRYLAKRSENYHSLVGLGFETRFAKRFQSTKRTERIRKMIKRGLSVEYINSVLVLRNDEASATV
jgi:ssDNA-binding Zn-finger/Zn-ribbon topoisomerase 1